MLSKLTAFPFFSLPMPLQMSGVIVMLVVMTMMKMMTMIMMIMMIKMVVIMTMMMMMMMMVVILMMMMIYMTKIMKWHLMRDPHLKRKFQVYSQVMTVVML